MNNDGFTLVELIVVMAIFGIILGAILNIIRPTMNMYSDNEATMDTNVTGSGVVNYLENNLKYATNILVLKDYVGVPQVNATGSLGGSSVSYKNCIIIDNNNLRGYSESGYSGSDTDTAQKRMGCTGCIISVPKINEGGIDLANSAVALGADYYGKYKFDISAGVSNVENMYTLDLKIDTYQPQFEGGVYTFDKTRFATEASINLVNINIDTGDSYIVQDVVDFSTSPDYTKYPRAAEPAGLTAQQKEYYKNDADNKYTYIFYDKKTSKEALKYTLTFEYSSTSPVSPGSPIDTRNVTAGSKVDAATLPTLSPVSGYLAPYWLDEDGNIQDFSDYTVTGDAKFVAIYPLDTSFTYYDAKFMDKDDISAGVYCTNKVPKGAKATDPGAPPAIVADVTVDFVGWFTATSGGGTSLNDLNVNSDVVFYPYTVKKPKVEFEINGAIDNSLTVYVKKGEKATIPSVTPTPPDADHIFEKWVVKGTSTNLADQVINGDTVFEAVFKEKSTSLDFTGVLTGTNPQWDPGKGGHGFFKVTLNNNSTKGYKKYKFKVVFSDKVTEMNISNVTISGLNTKEVTMDPNTYGNTFMPGQSLSYEFNVCPATVTIVDIQPVEVLE